MTPEKARKLASDYHGGQWTQLYMYSSSGRFTNLAQLRKEIQTCIEDEFNPENRNELEMLQLFIEIWYGGIKNV